MPLTHLPAMEARATGVLPKSPLRDSGLVVCCPGAQFRPFPPSE
jgi:hypothetical protein